MPVTQNSNNNYYYSRQVSYSQIAAENLRKIMDEDDEVLYKRQQNACHMQAQASRYGNDNRKKAIPYKNDINQRTVYVADLDPQHKDSD